jgi:hypothetical protein
VNLAICGVIPAFRKERAICGTYLKKRRSDARCAQSMAQCETTRLR